MRSLFGVLLALCLLSSGASAQQRVSPFVKYGKWVLLAGSAGLHVLAQKAHDRADAAFDELGEFCSPEPTFCALGEDGRYVFPQSEELYQRSLRYDRQARRWLIAGEAALLGSAALFIWELTRPKGRPENIPFEPELRRLPGAHGVGLRVKF